VKRKEDNCVTLGSSPLSLSMQRHPSHVYLLLSGLLLLG